MVRLRRAVAQMLTAGCIGATGDVSMQLLEVSGADAAELDFRRTARLSAYRMVQAPLVDQAWQCLDRVVKIPGIFGAVSKALADQALIMPPSLVGFFFSQKLLEGGSMEEALDRVRVAMPPAVVASLPFWFSVHCVTFSVVPEHLRMAWASSCAVFWNAFMSHCNRQAMLNEAK
eukprot:TRINITY_DN20465_c0_g1_i2.p1 TRINITY_DN20465_c0_g1~~TRINITY_DN20465_c0_g1_i2.p1  ORF type:complete len:197 (-),score=27.24 TRINITY_DN20465_c0_g1_i2:81-602(-)